MESAPPPPRPRRLPVPGDSPAGVAAALALVAVLAPCLGGSTQKWSQGIVFALFGLLLLTHPPRFSLGRWFNLAALAFVASGALTFLPAGWFAQPDWRSALTSDFAIPLAGTVTPQPWLSADAMVNLIAGLAWLYYVCSLQWDLREVRFAARLYAGGIVALAALCLVLYLAHAQPLFWHNQRNFGPFPNRNQTGNLFGLAAVIVFACAHEDIRRGNKRWAFWLLGLGILTAALVVDFSRSGIAILLVGITAWLGGFAVRERSAARVAVGLCAILIVVALLLLFGGETLERFHLRTGNSGVSADFRWLIFRDAFALIRASPWCGVGLGNFDSVFAIFRDASRGDSRAIHPDNDWIWLWTEMGWPAVVLVLAGFALLLRLLFPLKEGTNQRFRLAALIAGILFAAHGLVDVSGHRVGTALPGLFLIGLIMHRPHALPLCRWTAPLFRLIGLGLLAIGATWLIATSRALPWPGHVGVANAKAAAVSANRGRNFAETIRLTSRALPWAPLDWELYFFRAIAEVGAHTPAPALDDFRRARFLEPNAYEVPFEEGRIWLATQPVLALTAWREALRRAGPKREELFGDMIAIAAPSSPAVQAGLRKMTVLSPDYTLKYMAQVTGTNFTAVIAELLERDPSLQTFSDGQKAILFTRWSERGNLDRLAETIAAHPNWLPLAWRIIAGQEAAQKHFQSACDTAGRFARPPKLPKVEAAESIEKLQARLYHNPDDFAAGYALYRAQQEAGKTDDALLTLRHFTHAKDCPAYFHFLEAEAWSAKENWERAWMAWEKFLAQQK